MSGYKYWDFVFLDRLSVVYLKLNEGFILIRFLKVQEHLIQRRPRLTPLFKKVYFYFSVKMTLLSPILPSLTLLFISTFVQSDSVKFSTIKSYSEAKVWQFINEVQLGVSPRCAKSLRHVIPMLTASSTLDQQRQFFYKSFASGDAEQLISLDMDRWFQR